MLTRFPGSLEEEHTTLLSMQYHCMINAMTQKDYFDLIIFMNLYQGMSASVEGTVNPVMNVD